MKNSHKDSTTKKNHQYHKSLESKLDKNFAISPLDGRYFDKTHSISLFFSEAALIKYRLTVQIKWFIFLLKTLDKNNLIPKDNNFNFNLESLYDFLQKFLKNLHINQEKNTKNSKNHPQQEQKKVVKSVKKIEMQVNHDVKACEYFLKNLLITENTEYQKISPLIHFGCTSEDVNNLSYSLMIKNHVVSSQFNLDLDHVMNQLKHMISSYKGLAMISRTHGQAATPTTMGKELAVYYHRLSRQKSQLAKIEILGKIAGAVGNYNAHVIAYPNLDWQNIAKSFVEDELQIKHNPYVTQIESHDWLSELLDLVTRINTICTDLCQDIWSYISIGYFVQKISSQEVGSSIMPHKVNPIDFENAEGNFGLSSSLARHLSSKLLVSRLQRDLSDSTALRSLGMVFGYHQLAMKNLHRGLKKIEINPKKLDEDLNNSPELLAEAIQTIMRKHFIQDSYETLKELTRGKKITLKTLKKFIKDHPKLQTQTDDQEKLLALTVKNYTGLAQKLCDEILKK